MNYLETSFWEDIKAIPIIVLWLFVLLYAWIRGE